MHLKTKMNFPGIDVVRSTQKSTESRMIKDQNQKKISVYTERARGRSHIVLNVSCDNDTGYDRDEAAYKCLDLSKNEADDVTTHATLTSSSTAVTSRRKYEDGVADKSWSSSGKSRRRFCSVQSRDGDERQLASFSTSGSAASCRRLHANCSSASCTGHVVTLRPGCADETDEHDVTSPHDRRSLAVQMKPAYHHHHHHRHHHAPDSATG